MREIKFRAWEKNLKEIIPVHSIDFEKKMINTESAWRLFDEIELMQYTGLKDKDDKEIYESYICKGVDFKLKVEFYFIVKWHKNGYWYAYNNEGKGIGFVNNVELLEVVGNIYENPELIDNN